MLRHSPLPPLVLSAALTLCLALTGARTEFSVSSLRTKPTAEAPAVRSTAKTQPIKGVARAL